MEAVIPKAAQTVVDLGILTKLAAVIQVALKAEGVPGPIASKVTNELADRAQAMLVEAGVIHLAAPAVEVVDERP